MNHYNRLNNNYFKAKIIGLAIYIYLFLILFISLLIAERHINRKSGETLTHQFNHHITQNNCAIIIN